MPISFIEYDVKPLLSHVGIHRSHISQAPFLLQDAVTDPDEANRFMRMFYLFQGTQQEKFSLELQAKALSIRHFYKINLSNEAEHVRVLAIVAPGDMLQNLPVDYLLEKQGVELNLLYLMPHEDLPTQFPEHDVTIFALGQSSANKHILSQLRQLILKWPKPFINHPKYIEYCARDQVYKLLKDIQGLKVAKQVLFKRNEIVWNDFPCTIRPLDSHAGESFERISDVQSLDKYLENQSSDQFYVGEYLDCKSEDGYYRKFRVALIGGEPYVAHLAISKNWVVSYISAEMYLNEDKRNEESNFMQNFDVVIADKFKHQFREICKKIPLEYMVLDCSISKGGELIVFEIDNSAWVHNTDSEVLFPYKKNHMRLLMNKFLKLIFTKYESQN